jgi:hypothetical protein
MNQKIWFLFMLMLFFLRPAAQTENRPNVILIITDDQGYGDLGFTGNPHVQTPVIDRLAGESIRFNQFYVSPVCAPTRSSLMTGRYSLRTGVRDTYNGGATMAASEVTIAELLKPAVIKPLFSENGTWATITRRAPTIRDSTKRFITSRAAWDRLVTLPPGSAPTAVISTRFSGTTEKCKNTAATAPTSSPNRLSALSKKTGNRLFSVISRSMPRTPRSRYPTIIIKNKNTLIRLPGAKTTPAPFRP